MLFSATLSPWNIYADALGLSDNIAWLAAPATFVAEQLSVRIAGDVSTRYRDRLSSLAPPARIIAMQYEAVPGNNIAYFSSFDDLGHLAAEFSTLHPGAPMTQQSRRRNESEREVSLAQFQIDGWGQQVADEAPELAALAEVLASDSVLCADGGGALAAMAWHLGIEHHVLNMSTGPRVQGMWHI